MRSAISGHRIPSYLTVRQTMLWGKCVADRIGGNGVQPCAVGRIPMPFAAVMQPHISLHEMAIEAVKTKNRTLLRQAIACDPMASMALTLDKIKAMTDELLAADTE
ncbi:MAG TPA: hypothetical protein VHY37_02660 [Tepidisphaeraceae bacterium]|jgi:alpha-galactosidase|nr:hypothetical protein [Tepidisphaeraceae bacterium]